MAENTTTIQKIEYEHKLARYLWGMFIANTLLFIVGKIIGYLDFLSWFWIATPFVVSMVGAILNYWNWVYRALRFGILRIVLWMPIFAALFNSYCILKKYGTSTTSSLMSFVAVILTYFIITKFSGQNPGMPK